MADRITCPYCDPTEPRPSIYHHLIGVTLMGYHSFIDDEGWVHLHNPNNSGSLFKCGRGHSWTPGRNPCPVEDCEWNNTVGPQKYPPEGVWPKP